MNKELEILYRFIDFFSAHNFDETYNLRTDENGKFASEQTHIACIEVAYLPTFCKTTEDFIQIFKREYLAQGAGVSKQYFTQNLIKKARKTICEFENTFEYTYQEIRENAERFVKWLEALTPATMPKLPNEPLLADWEIKNIHDQLNDVVFKNITFESLCKAISNPACSKSILKNKDRNQGQMIGLIAYLFERINDEKWLEEILEHTGITSVAFGKKDKGESRKIKKKLFPEAP